MRSFLVRSRWWLALGAAAAAVFVLVWFQPQKLFLDDVVDEELPDVAATAVDRPEPSPEADPDEAADAPSDPEVGAVDDAEEATTPTPSDDSSGVVDPGPVELASGAFGSLGRYTTVGQVRVVELEDGRRFVRFEDFETSNGPDLFVYLSTGPADGSAGFTDDFVDLGVLKGNIGDQNYELPADVDLARYTSVVVYCLRFSSPFGAADLVLAT
jgi:hypothetical protein